VIAKTTKNLARKESTVSTVTIAVDLAKNVFELALAGPTGSIRQRKRLSRPQFQRFWGTQVPCRVVMEACASSHFWARHLLVRGFDVVLLPPQYVKPYRRRNKTDRADCEALLEADRCAGMKPVAVKSADQQAIIALRVVIGRAPPSGRHQQAGRSLLAHAAHSRCPRRTQRRSSTRSGQQAAHAAPGLGAAARA
jgi:hypothetical protein